jgi:hypothetical protein
MAIGVRIKSDNLSGKTAQVTFLQTTGELIDLGTQVIPFNYYDTNPYGEFSLYVPEYDYTYTLNVQEPYGQNQTVAQLGNVSGETTFSLGFLNFNNFTAEVIGLDIDATYWQSGNMYPMSESGYIMTFNHWGNDSHLVLFIDVNGNIVDQYSAITNSYQYDSLDGRISYFTDNANGVMYYFNGESVFQYTFDHNSETLQVNWDWDSTCLDYSFSFTIYNTGTTTATVYRVLYDGSVNEFTSYDTTIEDRNYGTYYSSNYFYEFTTLQSDDSISSLIIFDTSGTEIVNFDITPNTYINWYFQWYGNNSFNITMWNELDNNIDYLIYNFDGVTQNVSTTTHVRGNDYYVINVQYEDNFYPNNVPNGGIFIQIYGNTGSYYQGGGYEVEYLDIIYRLENETDLSTYVFQDSGSFDKTYNFYGYGNKNYYTFCTTGDNISSIFSITENGVNITQTSQNLEDVNGTNSHWFGEYFNYGNYTNSYSNFNSYLFSGGTIIDGLILDTSLGSNFTSNYDTFYMSNYIGDTYYVNNQVTGYTKTEYYNNSFTSYGYYTKDYYFNNSIILLHNQNDFTCKIITKDNVSNQFSIPIPNVEWDLSVGRGNFIYVYNDNSNNTRINLYNLDGALINSTVVNVNGWSDVYAGKDRYFVKQTTDDDQKLLTMISDTDVKQLTIDDQYQDWYQINDYILWD